MVEIKLRNGTSISHAFVESVDEDNSSVTFLITSRQKSFSRSYSLDAIEELRDMDTKDIVSLRVGTNAIP